MNLKKILKYANPDLLTVNEVVTDMQGGENIIAKAILDDVLNTDGITHFERGFDTGIGSQVNMLYYNSDKLSLYDQYYLDEDVNGNALTSSIDIYRLYYNNSLPGQDTVFFDHIVVDLKPVTPQMIFCI